MSCNVICEIGFSMEASLGVELVLLEARGCAPIGETSFTVESRHKSHATLEPDVDKSSIFLELSLDVPAC